VNLLDFGQRLIPTGGRSGLQTHIAATASVSLCVANEKLTAFVELESAHGKRAASPTESDLDRRTHARNSGAELLPGKPRESSLLAEMR
jgi:hypothetical protein